MVTLSKRHGLSLVLLSDCSVFSNRVRAISVAMGLTPVMWTRLSAQVTFDTGGIHFCYLFLIFLDRLMVFQQTFTSKVGVRLPHRSSKTGNTLWATFPPWILASSFLNMIFSNRRFNLLLAIFYQMRWHACQSSTSHQL